QTGAARGGAAAGAGVALCSATAISKLASMAKVSCHRGAARATPVGIAVMPVSPRSQAPLLRGSEKPSRDFDIRQGAAAPPRR
ncbi:hypothetical protein QH494_26375, partial [Sphingomonas sp. AR_OL41]|uniref:hypothetical protein n=1 Tax=Sphingomonas sp. AR_OL41 TaxID=3042729 RepID=UPI00248046E0